MCCIEVFGSGTAQGIDSTLGVPQDRQLACACCQGDAQSYLEQMCAPSAAPMLLLGLKCTPKA